MNLNLHNYDLIIINSSAGKDSLVAKYEVHRVATEQNYDIDKIIVSHQDLGAMEWKGTKELVATQSSYFGFNTVYSKRRNKAGYEETLLEYAERRGKWASNNQRWCTSDYKRAPGARIVTALTKDLGECKVLYVFGFRAEESPSRAKKLEFKLNSMLTTKKRTVYDWLPVHNWSTEKVWHIIKSNNLPYHFAYDLGMPRLSCCFCIFSPFNALVIAGIHNPELLDQYIEVEEKINHTFKADCSLASVKEAIQKGYKPKVVENWRM
ncbi:3'-phosphoadenosine 5'-phosphosulfate sulfotransferase (PAPS reductase)/FAD synthetase [Pustulibacterium marinum]|uniref:3'-phosphoadenosine 5'-phosphosulfate sulfotransferase (PAPS reductase)/FAD synthetase n=1 Tax=Pustulibacterium marinum TaxID=1224947 RepID=A0A1I7IWM6_9FLAO|nr:phosphoadenosine phosphosulfate reductase family protein [Pustulibacterium marinum]SFU77309.1 3'-phosphoadenosine 5'-phosphosulfate sulfotransferase (PAPS reductase)/FAD synthetase [Pustulibacterium marinum]